VTWPALPPVLGLPAAAGQEVVVVLGVRRADLVADEGHATLEVTDGRGTRRMIPVHVSRAGVPPTANSPLTGPRNSRTARGAIGRAPLPPYAGLWVGDVSVNAVSQSQIVNPALCPPVDPNDPNPPSCFPQEGSLTPTPVSREFIFRLMVHVDESGQARLLKEVIQMWKNGTPGTATVPEVPGHFALVTDDAQIPNFSGAVLRDGEPVGRRVSTAAYDFPGSSLDMNGTFSSTGNLTANIELGKTFATNPYSHVFHPDHDNKVQGQPTEFESYDVLRKIELLFSSTDPTGKNSPEWGSSIVGGTYRETFGVQYSAPDPQTSLRHLEKGIHKNPIVVEGTFQLRRVSLTARLNQ
jgi:hypothetical protein